MLEMFAVYALLLAGWGLYSQRRAAERGEDAATAAALAAAPSTPAIAVTTRERGTAARRHLSTTP
jgi:predicted transporter